MKKGRTAITCKIIWIQRRRFHYTKGIYLNETDALLWVSRIFFHYPSLPLSFFYLLPCCLYLAAAHMGKEKRILKGIWAIFEENQKGNGSYGIYFFHATFGLVKRICHKKGHEGERYKPWRCYRPREIIQRSWNHFHEDPVWGWNLPERLFTLFLAWRLFPSLRRSSSFTLILFLASSNYIHLILPIDGLYVYISLLPSYYSCNQTTLTFDEVNKNSCFNE